MERMCQHCGKKPASFYYKSVVNGSVNEVELCSDCASELGYADALQSERLTGHFFDLLMPEMSFGRDWTPILSQWLPQRTGKADSPSPDEPEPELLPQQEKWRALREENRLQAQLQQAIREENFERAAELRDEIRKKAE